ncbi:hypothetical protein NIES2111_16160 [Nostoc sp. NIES-2111]|nr:hypothetical protein NIES2111_16160 [Nostoc sp. NIES-2111]
MPTKSKTAYQLLAAEVGTSKRMKDNDMTTKETLTPVNTVGYEQLITRVTMSSRKQLREDKRNRKVNRDLTYNELIKYAEDYKRSHRLEEYTAWQLRKLGLNAVALPSHANGHTQNKQADIIITTESGQKLALEVKEARNRKCTLGLPFGDGTDGYQRLPERLIVDSCWAWDCKERDCERRGELLLGAIILCPIGRFSDEEHTVLGAVYCPVADWRVQETCNRGRYYEAYVATKRHMKTLEDLVVEVCCFA